MHGWSSLAAASASRRKRFRCASVAPLAEADHFECDSAVEAFLSRALDYALAAPADFFQQFIIAKVTEHSCWPRGLVRRCRRKAIVGTVNDVGSRFVIEQSKTFKKTGWANFIFCVSGD